MEQLRVDTPSPTQSLFVRGGSALHDLPLGTLDTLIDDLVLAGKAEKVSRKGDEDLGSTCQTGHYSERAAELWAE